MYDWVLNTPLNYLIISSNEIMKFFSGLIPVNLKLKLILNLIFLPLYIFWSEIIMPHYYNKVFEQQQANQNLLSVVGSIPMLHVFNPFVPNASFLYPLKTSENITVFWCFQWVQKRCIGNKCVKSFFPWQLNHKQPLQSRCNHKWLDKEVSYISGCPWNPDGNKFKNNFYHLAVLI